jgi:uncharacterized membrane protein
MVRWDGIREYARGSLLVLPIACAAVALVAGALLSQVELSADSPFAFQGTADDARTLLMGIAATMVTVIALLLGLAVVALQLSSTQFSPRLLRNFLRDRPNQIVLGVFVGTFAYSAGGLFTVGVSAGERSSDYPRFAVLVAVLLLFVSLVLLVYFADHLAHSLQVDAIMRVVGRNTLPVIRTSTFISEDEPPAVPGHAREHLARGSGYVQLVDVDQLMAAARRHRVYVRLRPRVGEHVVAGTVLAWVWCPDPGAEPPDPSTVDALLDRVVRMGFERTLEQDPGFGFRQLVDAACKALSPAVNDPYTAIQAIEHLSVLFVALARRDVGDHVARDADGAAMILVPNRRFADYLALFVGLIRRYGAGEPTVVQALLRLLGTVAALSRADAERWTAIERETTILVEDAELKVTQPADLAVVHEEASAVRRVLDARSESPAADGAARPALPQTRAGHS